MSPRRPRRASQLATALIEHSSDAIALVDEAGTVLYANPATARMLGLSITDIIGSNVFRWVHDDDMLRVQDELRQRASISPGVPVKNAFRLRHKDGTWRHIESVGVNRLDDPGIRGIIINYRDVTESKRAEEALREGEARYRQLTEQATDIIYNCDLDGRFTFVNPTATRLMKYTEQELLGRHFLSLIRNDYQQRASEFYERQRKEYIRSTYFEFPAIAKDGSEDLARPERADRRGARPPDRRPGDRPRHHRAPRTRRSAAAGAEDGSHRPAGRRRRARLQQRADGDSRISRSAVA